MDDIRKFGDFLDDDILEVEPVDEEDSPVAVIGSYIPPDTSNQSEEQIEGAFSKLSKKYDLDLGNLSVKDVLDNIDKIETDDSSFDLVASKIVTDYVGRVALRAIITEANMIDKVLRIMDNTPINAIDGDSLLILDKAFLYQDKLFSILDRYKKAGVGTSLKHIAEEKNKVKEDKISLSPDEIRKLVNEINKQNLGSDNK